MSTQSNSMQIKYPASMRVIHWTMAVIILGMIWSGWFMTPENTQVPTAAMLAEEMPAEEMPTGFDFYSWHKSFGMLILILVAARLVIRKRATIPALPSGFAPWEVKAAKLGHAALYTLIIVVPLMGYSMSSSFTLSDGVYFFGVNLPELLPKNDERFVVFQTLHRWLAYTLLGLIAVHLLGALKHRFLDRNRDNDVLSRMM
jgi:cytochrome b561